MTDSIVKEVREARAALAADFDFDLHKFFAWAREHTAAERQAGHQLPTSPNEALHPMAGAVVSSESLTASK